MHTRKLIPFAALGLGFGACANEMGPGSESGRLHSEGRLSIEVAPQEMDQDADFACYDIAVQNSEGVVVWHEAEVCTDEFGHGANGSLVYVGVCDAAAAPNTVTIKLTGLMSGSEDLANWEEAPTFVDTNVACVANGDTRVKATFFVLTEGEKGFLDISVNVETITCSAKIDCIDDFLDNGEEEEPAQEEEPTQEGEQDGDQDQDQNQQDGDQNAEEPVAAGEDGTIIVGLACEAKGEDLADLYMDHVVLTCKDSSGNDVSVNVDPAAGEGWQDGYPNAFVFGVLANAGLTADGNTSFWTLAIGVEAGWTDCSISARMAATNNNAMDGADKYPIIVAEGIDFGWDGAGEFSCGAHGLNGEGSGLESSWGLTEDLSFDACLDAEAGDVSVEACE